MIVARMAVGLHDQMVPESATFTATATARESRIFLLRWPGPASQLLGGISRVVGDAPAITALHDISFQVGSCASGTYYERADPPAGSGEFARGAETRGSTCGGLQS